MERFINRVRFAIRAFKLERMTWDEYVCRSVDGYIWEYVRNDGYTSDDFNKDVKAKWPELYGN
jgi:hypothetical protein